MSDQPDAYRTYVPAFTDDKCHFCTERAVWWVMENDSGEDMSVCDRHKFTAFS